VSAERALLTLKPSAGVHERLGHARRGQNRFTDAARSYVAAVNAASGPELEQIVQRVGPVVAQWVQDFEAGRSSTMRDAAKSVLSAMLPHQAGEGSETTKALLARLGAAKGGRSTLTAARLKDAIAVQVPALRACYARAMVHDPTLKGKLVIQFSVAEGGGLSAVRSATNGTNSKPLASCIEARIKALNLVTETAVEVTYPLVFTPI
jgi:hypothetical protein